MKFPAWTLWLLFALGVLALAILPTRRPALQSAGMATLTKSRKPVRKSVRRPVAKKPAASLGRLTLPPGRPAREVMAEYPEPSKEFNAEGVERIIASRADR